LTILYALLLIPIQWLFGHIGDREGAFPISFVEYLDEYEAALLEEDNVSHADPINARVEPMGKFRYRATD
jgi:hypothetical protein